MKPLLAAAAFCTVLSSSALAQTISDLRPLTLPYSVNHVFHFTPDDRTATITDQRIGTDGLDLYRIHLSGAADPEVTILSPLGAIPGITSDPSGARRAFRLAYGRVDHGRQDMLLLTAVQDLAPLPAPATIAVYRLAETQFQPVLQTRSTTAVCSAERALRSQFGLVGLPQQPSDPGPAATGCAPPTVVITVTPPADDPATAAAPVVPHGCAGLLREQHETLCRSYVYRVMGNTAQMAALTQQWAQRNAATPQCHSLDDLKSAADAALETWNRISRLTDPSTADRERVIQIGCTTPR